MENGNNYVSTLLILLQKRQKRKKYVAKRLAILSLVANKCPNEINVLLWSPGSYSCFPPGEMTKQAESLIKPKLTIRLLFSAIK